MALGYGNCKSFRIIYNQKLQPLCQTLTCPLLKKQQAPALSMPAPDSPALPWPKDAPWWRKTLLFLKVSPIAALLVYTGLSLAIEENYPFSNYPMYSNPSPERPYYTITDGDGQALPIQTKTGITCPKIGKIYRKKSEELARSLDIRANDMKPEHQQQIAEEMFAQLRTEAKKLNQPMPPTLQLMKTYISYQDGKVVEEANLIAREAKPVLP